MKKEFLKRIGGSIIKGFPILGTVTEAVKNSVSNTDADGKPKFDATLIAEIAIEGIVVIGLIIVMKKFGIDVETVKEIYNLLK